MFIDWNETMLYHSQSEWAAILRQFILYDSVFISEEC